MRGFGTVTVCIDEGKKWEEVEAPLTYYQAQGLLTIAFERVDGTCPGVWAKVALTPAGAKHLVAERNGVYQLKVFDLTFGAVTGIQVSEQMGIATAEYTLVPRSHTPFAGTVAKATLSRTATFSRYDDGWRLGAEPLANAFPRWIETPLSPALAAARRVTHAAAAAADPDRLVADAVLGQSTLVGAVVGGSLSLYVLESSDALELSVRGDPAWSPSIDVDVNQNGVIDAEVDVAYGKIDDTQVCAQFVRAVDTYSPCGVFRSAARLRVVDEPAARSTVWTIPKAELTSTKSVWLMVHAYNKTTTRWTKTEFSQPVIINVERILSQ
jgi:hypothetical protein